MTTMLYVGFYNHPDYHEFGLTNMGSVFVVKMKNGGMRFKFVSHLKEDKVFYCKRLEFMTIMVKRFYGTDCKFIA